MLPKCIENLINDLNKKLNVTSIVVTHQQSTILRTGKKIYFLKEGALLEPETPQTIKNSKNKEIKDFFNGIPKEVKL